MLVLRLGGQVRVLGFTTLIGFGRRPFHWSSPFIDQVRGFFSHPVLLPPPVRAAYKRPPTSRPTRLTPCLLGIHPLLFMLKLFYLFHYFSHLPSGHSIGRVIGRFELVETVVQYVGLTVDLPSTIQGPMLAWTWIWRFSRLTLLDAPLRLQWRHAGLQFVCMHW